LLDQEKERKGEKKEAKCDLLTVDGELCLTGKKNMCVFVFYTCT